MEYREGIINELLWLTIKSSKWINNHEYAHTDTHFSRNYRAPDKIWKILHTFHFSSIWFTKQKHVFFILIINLLNYRETCYT